MDELRSEAPLSPYLQKGFGIRRIEGHEFLNRKNVSPEDFKLFIEEHLQKFLDQADAAPNDESTNSYFQQKQDSSHIMGLCLDLLDYFPDTLKAISPEIIGRLVAYLGREPKHISRRYFNRFYKFFERGLRAQRADQPLFKAHATMIQAAVAEVCNAEPRALQMFSEFPNALVNVATASMLHQIHHLKKPRPTEGAFSLEFDPGRRIREAAIIASYISRQKNFDDTADQILNPYGFIARVLPREKTTLSTDIILSVSSYGVFVQMNINSFYYSPLAEALNNMIFDERHSRIMRATVIPWVIKTIKSLASRDTGSHSDVLKEAEAMFAERLGTINDPMLRKAYRHSYPTPAA